MGRTGIEPVTSSVSGKRATAAPTARADNGIRTRDPHLGKVMLYQLSHVRMLSFQNLEATPGFEPGVKALQASALPLGHVAIHRKSRPNQRFRPARDDHGADNGIRTRDP